MEHKYHIKYKEGDRKGSEFTLTVNKGQRDLQELDVEEAMVTATGPLNKEVLDEIQKIFVIEEVKEIKEPFKTEKGD